MEDLVGLPDREKTLALQNVVQVRLRDSGDPGEAALGDFAAAHAVPQMHDQPRLEPLKVNRHGPMYSLSK